MSEEAGKSFEGLSVIGLLLQKAIQRQIDRFLLIQLIVYNQNCLSSREMFFVYMHVLLV